MLIGGVPAAQLSTLDALTRLQLLVYGAFTTHCYVTMQQQACDILSAVPCSAYTSI